MINDQGAIVNLIHNISEYELNEEEIVNLSETFSNFMPESGTGLYLPLMRWLNEYTFPAEQSFSNIQKAKEVYPKLVEQLVKQGSSSACYFGTIHVEGSVELARAVQNKGQRGFIGKVCMLINSPDNYIENTEESLKGLAKLANEYDLAIQTHFTESCDEKEFTTSLYPSEHYKDVFEQVGLLGNKSVIAHCCYSDR